MKIEYHCSTSNKNTALIELLNRENIKYSEGVPGIIDDIIFDICSDHPKFDEVFPLAKTAIENELPPLILESAVFSKEEMESAKWFFMHATRPLIETRKKEYTFMYSCRLPSEITKYHHRTQVNPFVVKSMPKWKTKFNFASECCGDFSMIFCSDFAREQIMQSDIVGIDFMPVYKGNLTELKEDIHQFKVDNILPTEAFRFIGNHIIEPCPICGVPNYVLKQPMLDHIRVIPDRIPEGIDVFKSEMTVYEGWGEKLIIVSKKVYNLIAKDMKERQVRFTPIAW